MADEELQTSSPVPRTPAAATCSPSCAFRDEETAGTCALCQKPICKNCGGRVNRKRVCVECRDKVVAELGAERAGSSHLMPAVVAGIAAALLCGAAWATMVVVTNFEIGYAAVGVGYLTGLGVVLGARKKRGPSLQWIAVACSILGLVLGKYFTVVHAIVTHVEEAKDMSYFDPRFLRAFVQVLPKTLSPFDALWVFIALRVAWRIPKAPDVDVG